MNQSNSSSVQTEIFLPENIRSYTKYTKRYCAGIMVFCFVVGTDLKSAFEVEGFEGMSISKFKDKIYGMKKNNFKDKGFDSCDLNLWKVNIPSDTPNILLETLQSRSRDMDKENITIKELGGKELTPFNNFGDIFTSSSENIRIIVQPPFSADQELDDITRIIAQFGYLPRQNGLGGTLLFYNSPGSVSDSDSTNEGVKLNDRSISLRFVVIKNLIKELINKKVILVRAPPFTGKTSLAQILEHTLIKAPEYSHYRVIRISLIWGGGIDWDNFGVMWEKFVGVNWKTWILQCSKIPSILIVDETQAIYEDKEITGKDRKTADQFWMTVKSLLQDLTNIYIIMFAAYGYKSSNNTGLATPVKIPDNNCKSLVDINFSPKELETYVTQFCSICFKKLEQQGVSNFYEYIQIATGGHAGLVSHILTNTKSEMKNRIDNKKRSLTWEDILKYLNSKKFDLTIYSSCRAVPMVHTLNDEQKKLCNDTFMKEKISYSHNNKDAVALIKIGVLMVVDNDYLTFAAPLLERAFFQQMYGTDSTSEETPKDLHDFIVKIFTAMCCDKLSKKILRETLGYGSDGRLLEQTWQKEFYRIGTRVLGKRHFLSCDVGSSFKCGGKLDFYVDQLDWAIELLRDGEGMAEHKKRFDPIEGKYKEIVKYAKSVAIIDIRSIGILDDRSEAKKVREVKEDFIHVSCSKNFDAFRIESFGKETVTIQLQD